MLQWRKFICNSAQAIPLIDFPPEEIVKVLCAIRFVVRRRNQGGRNYLKIVRKFVRFNTNEGRLMIIPKNDAKSLSSDTE